jgi:hypothetical protein
MPKKKISKKHGFSLSDISTINLKNRNAKQIILHEADYPIRKFVFSELQRHCAANHRSIFPESDSPLYQTIHITEEFDTSIEKSA